MDLRPICREQAQWRDELIGQAAYSAEAGEIGNRRSGNKIIFKGDANGDGRVDLS